MGAGRAPKNKNEEEQMKGKKGFTLIELLIVVAIIGILAAIAIPNFLNAQVRSKVARTKAELRNLITGMEIYKVDTNKYPPYGESPSFCDYNSGSSQMMEPMWLTTPIAYLTAGAANAFDPFMEPQSIEPTGNDKRYNYFNLDCVRDNLGSWAFDRYGNWRLTGSGPDGVYFQNQAGTWTALSYDPTNGTISYGDIMRTSKVAELSLGG